MAVDRAFLNVMIISWGFMLVFTAFQTMGNIEVSRTKLYLKFVTTSASRSSACYGSLHVSIQRPSFDRACCRHRYDLEKLRINLVKYFFSPRAMRSKYKNLII